MTDLKNSAVRVTKILLRAQDDPEILQELEQFRHFMVVMFSDIQGSTGYFEKYGDAAGLFMVRQCNDIIRGFVQQFGGTLIKTIGDGSMATFPETESAVKGAIEIQRTLARSKSLNSESNQIAVRIGIHAGTGIVSTNDVFGDVVNVAARVESAAKPRQILLSEEAYSQLRDFGISIQKIGTFKLKGKSEERTLFEVNWELDTSGGTRFGPPIASGSSTLDFKLQILSKTGDVVASYPIQPEIGIRISGRGELQISNDTRSAGINARFLVEAGQLWLQEGDGPWPSIFIRLSGAHVLENGEVFLAGKQVFRYEEEKRTSASLSARTATQTITDLLPSSNVVSLCRIDSNGNSLARYSISNDQIQFGRTRGEHLFPQDSLMSRAHLKISRRGDDLLLEDLGSRNGTFLRVSGKSSVSAGSELIISGQLLKVVV
jgi:class 3 adenylate cyclase